MEILNSIDLIITTNDFEILLIKRDTEPEIDKLALIGGIQNSGELFEYAITKILKKKLKLSSNIKDDEIKIENLGKFKLKQIKTYDSKNTKWSGNSTVFSIETNLSKEELIKKIHTPIKFCEKDNIPKLAFEHNRFLNDYFFFSKNYTIANTQDIGITVDIVIFTVKDKILKILLTKRSKEPFIGHYTLPGGFIEKEKSLTESAKEILERDTNISNVYLEQLYSFGEIGRDSRGRIITIAYYALLDYSKINLVASQKYDEINWFSISDLRKIKIGFDHKDIINLALDRIQNKIEYTNLAFQLLPEKFTLAELQEVYETILDKEIDKRNFRKKIAELDMLDELNEYKKEGRMRPARYHRFKERTKETVIKAKKWI